MAVMKRLPGRGPNSVGDGRTALFTSTLKGWPSRRCLSYLKPFFCQSLSVSRDLNGLSGHDHREENLAGSIVLQEGTFAADFLRMETCTGGIDKVPPRRIESLSLPTFLTVA
ncbi:hypothetical protein ACFX13_024447 [Malus domestica]